MGVGRNVRKGGTPESLHSCEYAVDHSVEFLGFLGVEEAFSKKVRGDGLPLLEKFFFAPASHDYEFGSKVKATHADTILFVPGDGKQI